MKDCPEEFVKFANRLADTAGEIHRRHFAKTLGVEIKPDGSPVTPVDRETERELPSDVGLFCGLACAALG
ncbi:MAG: hypothetical protein ACE5H7_13155 [Acidiferrobacterales bacterium]